MAKNNYLSLDEIAQDEDQPTYFSLEDAVGDPVKQDRSYLGAALQSGARSLVAAGATIIDSLNPFTLSEEDAAVLYKNDPEGFKRFQEKSASAVLQRFAAEQTKRAREVMQEVDSSEKGAVSDKPVGQLEYATLDPEKAAYLSPTRVAGDVLQSLPTTLALALSGYFSRGKSIQAYESALARETARGVPQLEAQALARAEAVREGAKSMAITSGISEGVVTGAQQYNQTLDEVKQISPEILAQSPEYQSLLEEGYDESTAKALLANKVAAQSGVTSGVTTGLISAAGGRFLGGMIGEGGKLLPRVGKGFAIEGLTEAPQSSLEQINQNLAMRRVDPSQDIFEGAGEAGVAGFVVGGVTGGAFGAAFGSPRRKLAEEKLRTSTNASDAAIAADELAGSVDELTSSVDQYLSQGVSGLGQQQQGLIDSQSPNLTLQQRLDREAELLAQAGQAGTEFDRRMAMDQINTLREQPEAGASTGFVDLTPMDEMQAQQRLAVLRDQTAQAGGNALGLTVVPHPSQPSRFAIAEQQLPSLDLPTTTTPISTQEAQARIEASALAGSDQQRRAEDSPRQNMISRAMAAIESRGGVASPMEAELLRQANMGQPFDRIDPNLAPQPTPTEQIANRTGFAIETAPRETVRPAALEQANTESFAEQTARNQANQAQAETKLNQQIQETSQPAALPNASEVISALVVPGAQRSAEQTSLVKQAESRYDPVDFSIMQRAATAPFQLSADERVRLKELRNPVETAAEAANAVNAAVSGVTESGTNVPEMGTTVPNEGTGLTGTRVLERLGQPTGGRIITSGAKFSTPRAVAPGATVTIADGGTSHSVNIVDTSRLGAQGKLLQQVGRIFGKKLVVFESDTLQADGFVMDDDNQSIFLNTQSQISPLAVFGHELTHLFKRDNAEGYAALESVVQRQLGEGAMDRFTQEYGEGANLEELTSDLVGNRFQEADFWQSVFDEIAAQNPEGARGIVIRMAAAITKAINAFMRLVRQPGFQADQYVKNANEIKKAVRTALAQYAQNQKASAMQMEGGMAQVESRIDLTAGSRAEPATTQDSAQATEQVEQAGVSDRIRAEARQARVELGQEPAQTEAAPATREERQRQAARTARQQMGETITASPKRQQAEGDAVATEDQTSNQRQYKLDIAREDRETAKAAALSAEEQGAILRDAAANNVPEARVRELLAEARETKKRYPRSAGWAPLKVLGLEFDPKKNEASVKYKKEAYAFNRPPGETRAPAKMDQAWAKKVADEFEKLILDIYRRGEAGDKNAQIIIGHQTWYRNVAAVLRAQYGGFGDLLADLLGATSPNTPVDTNWRFAVEVMNRFVKGDFNAELAKFDAYVKAGNPVSKYPAADKIKQISGKLYGMNSGNAMVALLDMWRVIEPGSAPKARNFALNLIGQSGMATIDVWAARMLRRAANSLRGADLPRIPPPAEQGVSGTWNANSSAVTGEFGFGAAVMEDVSTRLQERGYDVTAPDLQAIAWFAEKELWGQKGWTTKTGEGGSFEENIEQMPAQRFVGGLSIQQGEAAPQPDQVSLAQARLMSVLSGDSSVIAARAMPTRGLYGGVVEESFDLEVSGKGGEFDPSMLLAEMAKLSKEYPQYDFFLSEALPADRYSPNARPGIELYFKTKKDMESVLPVLEAFTSRGQDGFTLAVDPRAKDGEYIGVRLQYVPEISMRWDEELRARLQKPDELEKEIQAKFEALNDVAAELSNNDSIAYAAVVKYDTLVIGKEDYDAFIERIASGRDRAAGGEAWFGQPIRAHVERAVARLERDEGQGRQASVYGASTDLSQGRGVAGEVAPGVSSTDDSAADVNVQFSRRRKPAPKETVKAYKLFRVDARKPGQLFPLFVNANDPVDMGVWLDADVGPLTDKGKVKSKIGELAYRPGWHAGDVPIATHIGSKSDPSQTAPDVRPENHVWAEVEFAADRDWQTEANKRGTNAQGKLVAGKAQITDRIPTDGYYRYKTNPNMTGEWLIGGSMKVNRILSDDEVAAINEEAGVEDLPREQPFDAAKYGLGGKFSRQRNTELTAAADAIAAMDPEVRDNTELGDFPGAADGYMLYEARQLVKKPSDKLKRVTANNTFALWQDYEYVANVEGDMYGVTKQEDPDDPDDDSKFVFAYERLADPNRKLVTTTTDQVDELFKEMRASGVQLSRRRPQVDTPEFKRWFGNSKVVDKNGEPMVVYHGGSFDEADSRGPIGTMWWTSSKEDAQYYADQSGANVTSAYLSISNPRVLKRGEEMNEVVRIIDKNKYDGVHDPETGDWVTWNPSQIKSATGNQGTFDPNNADITMSRQRTSPFYSQLAKAIDEVPGRLATQPAAQWKAWLAANASKLGIKKEEIEWTGINEYLDLRGKEKVTKAEIAEYLDANGVQVEEVMLGDSPEISTELRTFIEDRRIDYPETAAEWVRVSNNLTNFAQIFQKQSSEKTANKFFGLADEANAMAERLETDAGKVVGETKYSQYTLPGAKDYRELLLTLPPKGGVTMEYQVTGAFPASGFKTRREAEKYIVDFKARLAEMPKESVQTMRDLLIRRPLKINEYESKESRETTFKSSHWDQKNILAHIRFNERTDATGARVLFIEEMQSDWAQEGRKKGFKSNEKKIAFDDPEYVAIRKRATNLLNEFNRNNANPARQAEIRPLLDQATEAERAIARRNNQTDAGIPRAPFVQDTKAWLGLATKRVIAYAVENGFDKVAFVNGQQSAERYDLSKQIEWLAYGRANGSLQAYDKNRQQVIDESGIPPEKLPDYIGKEAAEKLLAQPQRFGGHLLEGQDLKIGGKGMIKFYDQIVPQVVNDVLKKVGGGKLEPANLRTLDATKLGMEFWSIKPEYRMDTNDYILVDQFGKPIPGEKPSVSYDYAMDRAIALNPEFQTEQLGFTITDEMKAKVAEGLPLFSRRRRSILGQPIALASWTAPTDTKLDDVVYKMQDKMIDTKRVVQSIKQAIGNIDDKWNPYLQEELYHGRTAKATKDFLNDELRPLLQEMAARNVEMAELEEYLHNRHAEERNVQIAKVNPNMPDGGSGIDTADARAFLAGLDPAKRRQLEDLARRVDRITANTRQLLINTGLETQDTIDAWEGAYKNYVPLQREDLDFSSQFSGMGTGQGYQVKGPSSKRATGSSRPVVDILANVAMQRERAIVRAEKTRVAQAVYGLAVQNPNTDFWLAIDPAGEKDPTKAVQALIGMGINPADAQNIVEEPKQSYLDPRTGLVTQRVNPLLRNSPNVLAVRINGEEKYVFFNANDERSQRMVSALKNLDAEQLSWAVGLVAQVTRYFAAVNTQYNPIFGVINLIRDTQGATLQLSTTPIADRKKEVMSNIIPALRGIYADVRATRKGQQRPGGVWASLWEEFQREGGQTGFRDQFSRSTERAEALQRMLDPASWANSPLGKVFTANGTLKVPLEVARKTAAPLFDWLSDYNETMENAVRLSAYKAAKGKGLTNAQAASIAKNLTVNFNRKGEIGAQAGAWYAFYNAAMQGTKRLIDTLRGPAGKKIMAGGLLLGVVQALALAAAGFDDDEPPDFVKERNLIIPLANGKYLTIPMPLGYNVIPNTSRVLTEFAMSGWRDPSKRVGQIAGAFMEMFNPIGNAGWSAQTLAPTIVDPLVALSENRDWTGKPIAKKDMNSLNPTPGYTRAKETASWFGKELSYFLNLASGGTKYKPGLVSPTPDQIDYLIGQVTGGVGRELQKVEQTVTSSVTGEELPPYKIPLAGRFYGDSKSSASESNRFYENLTRLNEHENEIKGRRKNRENPGEYLRENPEARLVNMANQVERDVSEMRKRRREMLEKGASKESIKLIEERITTRMKRFNDRVRVLRDQEPNE